LAKCGMGLRALTANQEPTRTPLMVDV